MKVAYTSNNSGGNWWLKDEDWKALEKAGWYVEWGNSYFCHSDFSFHKKPEGKPEPCKENDSCPSHRRFDTWQEMTEKDRWLDCLATKAEKEFDSLGDALREFEKITGQSVTDEGCNCCGSPHRFNWGECATGDCSCPPYTPHSDYNFGSGDDLSAYLYDENLAGKSKRELLDEITKSK
jgi:hypothetical protein